MDSTLPQSNSAIKREARIKNQGLKNFGGKLDNFENNRERHFNQRMLKAYLKGQTTFPFGFESVPNPFTGKKDAIYHSVLLTDKTVNPELLDKLLAEGYNDPGKVFGGTSNNKGKIRKDVRKRISDKFAKENPKELFKKPTGFMASIKKFFSKKR